MHVQKIVCWEPTDVTHPLLPAAGQLYEETLASNERIPWEWIQGSVGVDRKPGSWVRHLILATPEGETRNPKSLAGYVYGAYLAGYGGYLCYVGVAPWARKLGVGTSLYEAFFNAMRADARRAGEALPFVLWESHRPEPEEEESDLWNARTRLFARVGGMWVEGVDFLSPNFEDDEEGEPVALQLFVKPEDEPVSSFTPQRLRELIAGLHDRVYRNEPGEPLYDETLYPGCEPRLVLATRSADLIRTL